MEAKAKRTKTLITGSLSVIKASGDGINTEEEKIIGEGKKHSFQYQYISFKYK